MRNSMFKSAVVALTLTAFSMSVIGEAQARIGGGSKSSSSSASSSRASASPARANTASRVGGGGSMGMSRASTMNAVRSQPRPAPQAPAYAQPSRQAQPSRYAQDYRSTSPSPAPQPSSKRNWVAPAAAGVAAGALAGYALANSGNSQQAAPAPQQYQQPVPQQQYQQAPAGYAEQAPAPAPAYAPQAPAYAPAQQMAPAYAAPQSSGGFGFGSFLLLALLAGIAFFAYRRYAKGKADVMADIRRTGNAAKASADTFKSSFNAPAAAASTASSASAINLGKGSSTSQLDNLGDELMANAEKFYRELQELNNQGDLAELRNRVGDDGLFDGLAYDIQNRTAPSQTEVLSVQASMPVPVEDQGYRYLASVRYVAELREGPFASVDYVDEVFHFVKDKGVLSTWKLAGIEQVENA